MRLNSTTLLGGDDKVGTIDECVSADDGRGVFPKCLDIFPIMSSPARVRDLREQVEPEQRGGTPPPDTTRTPQHSSFDFR